MSRGCLSRCKDFTITISSEQPSSTARRSVQLGTSCAAYLHRPRPCVVPSLRTSCPPRARTAAVSLAAPVTSHQVAVKVTKTSWNSRKLDAVVTVPAPLTCVWRLLTDYDNLAEYIPSLELNKCIERRPNGAVLYQVGAQDVAMGIKFSAACTLECTEYVGGVPTSLCSADGSDGLFPSPLVGQTAKQPWDITFSLLDGDFQAFKGIWRMTQGPTPDSTVLAYSLYVMPQAWLPVRLIQSRIEKEVLRNLEAVQQRSGLLAASPDHAGALGS